MPGKGGKSREVFIFFICWGIMESGSVLTSGKAINYQFEIIFKRGDRNNDI
jgi:hypothetical protein